MRVLSARLSRVSVGFWEPRSSNASSYWDDARDVPEFGDNGAVDAAKEFIPASLASKTQRFDNLWHLEHGAAGLEVCVSHRVLDALHAKQEVLFRGIPVFLVMYGVGLLCKTAEVGHAEAIGRGVVRDGFLSNLNFEKDMVCDLSSQAVPAACYSNRLSLAKVPPKTGRGR